MEKNILNAPRFLISKPTRLGMYPEKTKIPNPPISKTSFTLYSKLDLYINKKIRSEERIQYK
ncbi:hypothetical protein [Chryseobacterium nematophagum]|uniref:hypothetical protein n=1 Tax=Chryseobacterium nematophagum TaxID=2305228 RepID=UPI0011C35A96|nr:hypothetical protein [Chryseobacterium nematophagum]